MTGRLHGLFRKKEPRNREALERVRGWCMAGLGTEGVSLTISEVDCGDPACPGLETIILVMREGQATQAVKVRKPLPDVIETDIAEAMRYL